MSKSRLIKSIWVFPLEMDNGVLIAMNGKIVKIENVLPTVGRKQNFEGVMLDFHFRYEVLMSPAKAGSIVLQMPRPGRMRFGAVRFRPVFASNHIVEALRPVPPIRWHVLRIKRQHNRIFIFHLLCLC